MLWYTIMISSTNNTNTYIICLWCIFFICLCSAKDNLTIGEFIQDGVYLESAEKKFQMGFFPYQKQSERRYVGIWYTMDPNTVVWVANRDNPVINSSGILKFGEDGELMVLNFEKQKIYTIAEAGGEPQMMLQLLDSGNAVLIDVATGFKYWESFNHPTDTFLPGMEMDRSITLTSWKNVDDPGTGSFVFQQDETKQYSIINSAGGSTTHWKSGSESTKNFEPYQMQPDVYHLLMNIPQSAPRACGVYRQCRGMAADTYVYKRLLMNYTGNIQLYIRNEQEKQWSLDWKEPMDNCSIYQLCGKFGLCSPTNDSTTCSCLTGFEFIQPEDPSVGCKHKNESCGGKNDKFNNISKIKLATPADRLSQFKNDTECKKKCLESCRCTAYSYREQESQWTNCWIWDSDLYNLQINGTDNISIRIYTTTEGYPQGNSSWFLSKTNILIFSIAILLILLSCILGYLYYRRRVVHQQGRNAILQMENNERWATDLLDMEHPREEDTESIGIPFVQFESILAATDNFSDANKLGEGGFGPVYKGKLPGGLEVAVKRLSSLSGQGLQEFRNEVILIAKLQHRNLVRLLGYCMKGNEKILLYEYMPNKSLDAFIFDQTPSTSLDWAKRYEIILGIARGLLYLHQDSRLRIIHRDLKTSNILLDEDMNPKISDFGLAKIVEGRETESTTNRVIGTYGYMAPEYALDGLFSVKSDVFSFGVVVLEIISGKKNTVSFQLQQSLSLLGYAWSLWNEDKPFELMDPRLLESSNSNEVLKCITVGLLCVQEDPGSRPTMTNVGLMLGGDITSLPTPTQPAFVTRKIMSSSSSSSYNPGQTQTNNTLTITLQEGR